MLGVSQRAGGSTLSAVVRSHVPFDSTERAHRARIVGWLAAASDPLDRDRFDPGHAVASAFIVSADAFCVALIHHGRLRRWLQPGGHAEAHEHQLSCVAAREASEELGIDVTADGLEMFDLDVHTIPGGRGAPEHVHFDVRFIGSATRQPLAAATDAIAARWFSATEVRALSTDPGLLRMLDKAAATGYLRA